MFSYKFQNVSKFPAERVAGKPLFLLVAWSLLMNISEQSDWLFRKLNLPGRQNYEMAIQDFGKASLKCRSFPI
jgi:hypothetical protein